ncbi:MAG TPA: DUF3857 domain-containing protein [Candidatus Kapabacteria bacterium]|nr:DUF3857 domain-containing protein [Candidatus Kapabacteria bacterium]
MQINRLWRTALILLAGALLLYSPTTSFAVDTPLAKAWDAFAHNRNQEARTLFLEAEKDPANAEEARIGLIYVDMIDKDNPEVIKAFSHFAQSSKNVAPYWHQLWSAGSAAMTDEDVDFLIAQEEKPGTTGAYKMYLDQRLGYYYQLKNSASKAKKYFSKGNAIRKWNIVGEFDNISGGGFDKHFDPIDHPEPGSVFKNREGADVKWFNLVAARNDGWVDLTSPFYANNTIMYAQTFCNSPSDQMVQLRLGMSGSFKVWVNDKLIYSESEEQLKTVDSYIIPIQLLKGNNRILLQIGESEIDECEFLCRLTDNNGTPIENLECTDTYSTYRKDYDFTPIAPLKPFDEEFFEAKYNADSSSFLNNALLGLTYLTNDKRPEARRALKRACKLFPENTYLNFLMIQLYRKTSNHPGIRSLVEKIKTTDPNSPMGLLLAFDEAYEIEDYDKADSINQKLESIYGETSYLMTNKIKIYSAKKQTDKFLETLDKAYDKFPNDYTIVSTKYSAESKVRNNPSGAVKILKSFLSDNSSASLSKALLGAYLQQGNGPAAFALLDEMIDAYPDMPNYSFIGADICYNIGSYDKGIKYLNHCIDIAPYIGSYYTKMGELLQAQKENEDAMKYYKKALYYSPSSFDTREQIREIEGKPKIFNQFTSTDPYAAIRSAPSQKDYPNNNSIILLDEVQLVTYKEHATEEKYALVVKVLNASGVDNWKEISIPYSEYTQKFILEKAEVVKASGEKIASDNDDNHLVFTNLAPGDAINVSYRLQNYPRGSLSSYFWFSKVFDHYTPSIHQKLSLLIHPDVKFDHIESGGLGKPTVTHKEEYDLYEWTTDSLKELGDERYSPETVDIGKSIHISNVPNWDMISKWYSTVSKTKARRDYEVKEVIADLFPTGQTVSPAEKVRRIYNYIVENVRYSSVPFRQSGIIPQKASAVINTGIGDCKDVSTLFASLTAEVGLDAQLVLVNTRDKGRMEMQLPSTDFNHCIARIKLNNNWYYVELTNDNLPLGTIGPWLNGAFVLPVTEIGSEAQAPFYLDHINQQPNIVTRDSKVEFTGEGMTLSTATKRIGYAASTFRNDYKGLTKDQREKQMLESMSQNFPHLQLNTLSIDSSLNTTGDSLWFSLSATVPDAITEVDNMKLFKIPWTDPLETFEVLNAKERKYPLELLYFYMGGRKYSETLEMTMPAGFAMSAIPEDVSMKTEFGSYSIHFQQKGNKVIGLRQFELSSETVPIEKFQAFKEFYNKIMKNDTKQFSIKPAAEVAPAVAAPPGKKPKGKGK